MWWRDAGDEAKQSKAKQSRREREREYVCGLVWSTYVPSRPETIRAR